MTQLSPKQGARPLRSTFPALTLSQTTPQFSDGIRHPAVEAVFDVERPNATSPLASKDPTNGARRDGLLPSTPGMVAIAQLHSSVSLYPFRTHFRALRIATSKMSLNGGSLGHVNRPRKPTRRKKAKMAMRRDLEGRLRAARGEHRRLDHRGKVTGYSSLHLMRKLGNALPKPGGGGGGGGG